MATKKIDWTDALTTALIEAYKAGREAGEANGKLLPALIVKFDIFKADKDGKAQEPATVPQVRAKLVNMQEYIKDDAASGSKPAKTGTTREDLTKALEIMLGVGTDDFNTMQKAKKDQLELIVQKVKEKTGFEPEESSIESADSEE